MSPRLLPLLVCLASSCARSGYDSSGGLELRIVGADGAAIPTTLLVGQSIELEAALFGGERRVETTAVIWDVVGSNVQRNDLHWTAPQSATATFTAATVGEATVLAQQVGSQPRSAVAGPIRVLSTTAPATLLLLRGDGQRALVDNPLPQALVVGVRDASGEPVQGVPIAFEATLGDGSIAGASPVPTDADGEAAMTVQLGPRAGSNNHAFTAQIVGRPDLRVSFVASAIAGEATTLVFVQQPVASYAAAPFEQQPVVALQDALGNVVSATEDVALAVIGGSGTLTGSTTATMVAGRASFAGLGYDTVETGLVIRASSAGLSVDSAPLDLAQLPPGACQTNDQHFTSAAGGCKDLATGLVWSAIAPGVFDWRSAVWDGLRGGSQAEAATDLGRTNDYDPQAKITAFDSNPAGYCHSLFEGGTRDWRLPGRDELLALAQHLQLSPGALLGDTSARFWTSLVTPGGVAPHAWYVVLATRRVDHASPNEDSKVICVRGGWSGDLHLEVTARPKAAGSGVSPVEPLELRIRDALDNPVYAEGVPLTLQSDAPLGGTLEASTDVRGQAAFSGWSVDRPGDATVTVSGPGITPAQLVLKVGAFPHSCAVETPGAWVTADGGCKDVGTGLVWSTLSPPLTWHEAVWDADSPPPPVPAPADYRRLPDVDDAGRRDDYSRAPTSSEAGYDGSYVDYCHDLSEGSQTDWRLPTTNELSTAWALAGGAAVHFGFRVDRYLWSGVTTVSDAATRTTVVELVGGTTNSVSKSDRRRALCVRTAP